MKKFAKMLMIGAAISFAAPGLAFSAGPEQVAKQALDMAGEQNFDAALSLIGAQDADTQHSYDVRFARARILSWSGNHDASDLAYKALMRDYPGNPDIQNGYGYLEYYRGNYANADALFRQVLENFPNYEDALNGIKSTEAARLAKRRGQKPWRFDINAETSSFSNGQSDWNNQSLRAEYVPGDVALSVAATRYHRFGLDDVQLSAGVRSSNDRNWDWEVGAGFTPSADFRPDITGLARVGHKLRTDAGTTYHVSLGYQIDDYELAGTIHQLSPQLMAYLKNGMILTGRLIHVMPENASNQTGYLVSGSVPVVDRLKAQLGYANAPEDVNSRVISTETVFGGLSFQISDSTDIHGTYTRDDRKNTYIRDAFNVGLTQRY